MRLFKVMILSIMLALIVYFTFRWATSRKTFLSPLPEEGIKVIQLSPTK